MYRETSSHYSVVAEQSHYNSGFRYFYFHFFTHYNKTYWFHTTTHVSVGFTLHGLGACLCGGNALVLYSGGT
jgi:hypothetical protein